MLLGQDSYIYLYLAYFLEKRRKAVKAIQWLCSPEVVIMEGAQAAGAEAGVVMAGCHGVVVNAYIVFVNIHSIR
jgi:hypothetical protein